MGGTAVREVPERPTQLDFGVDLNSISYKEDDDLWCPPVVPGRVAHIDGDFLAYQVSAHPDITMEHCENNSVAGAERLRKRAGAESMVLHLTARHSNKGGRRLAAIQADYQATRKSEKPRYLEATRQFLRDSLGGKYWTDREADDGMGEAAWEAWRKGHPELHVTISKDKDLRMLPGQHMEWDTGRLIRLTDTFGFIGLDNSKTSTKLVGYGTKFFWAQLLMGDTADNIKGLPKVWGKVLAQVQPTKAYLTAREREANGNATAKQLQLLDDQPKKSKPCGPVLTHLLLNRCKTYLQARRLVTALYRMHGENCGFKHWRTKQPVPWQDVFYSEAFMLWMMREAPVEGGEADVRKFMAEAAQGKFEPRG